MTYSIIQKSQLEGANRLDAEYYQPEYFIDFQKGDWQPIGSFLDLCQYGISQSMNEEKRGFPILKMNDINDAFLVDDNVKYVDLYKSLLPQYELEIDDVLFNRVNAENFVGRTGIFKLNRKMVFASYLIRLRLENNSKILPDYLNIFLNSSFGIKQIRKWMRRAVNQANVNAEELKQIKIAVLPRSIQEFIKKLSDDSWQQIKLSKKYYFEAESLLLEELGLKDFMPKEDLSFVVDYSDVKKEDRIDADFFQPKYAELIGKLGKTEKLAKIAERKTGLLKTNEETEYEYIEISDINVSNSEVVSNVILGKDLPANAKMKIEGGELIISKVRPTRGAISIIPDAWQENYVASGAFSIFGITSPEREFLQVVLRSIIGKLQLEKPTTGTSYPTVTDEDVENILIPVLSKTTQQKIANLVRKSHEARKKSRELLEEAKRKVEEMIERGGEN